MVLFQDNLSPYLTAVEQASTPANPASGNQKLFVRTSDHVLCYLNSSGTVTPLASSPMTTKGDLYGHSTVDARIPIGSDTQVLTADSSQTLGLKWATPSAGFANPMTTKGDVILGDTGGTATRLGAGTSAYVLTSNGAAAFPSWQAPGGGAGSTNAPDGKPYNFTPAVSPATVDDEFGDGTVTQSGPINGLVSKWTKHNMGTSGWLAFSDTKAPGCALFAVPTGQSSDQAIYQATPAGDFTIAARWSAVFTDTSRQMWALFAVDTSGNGISVAVDIDNSEICLRPLTSWVQSGVTVDIFPAGSVAGTLAYSLMAGLPITAYLRKASGVYYGSMTVGDRLKQPGLLEGTVTPSAFTNAYVGFGRIFTGGGAVNIALDYFRQTA